LSQSSTIAFFLLGGFIVFITIKGELPSYLGVLGIGSQATASQSTIGALLTNPVASAQSILTGITTAAMATP
jgi:hypothetical protein